MTDRATRILALIALAVSFLSLVVGGYAVWLGEQYREDVRRLGEALSGSLEGHTAEAPLRGPPPELDPDDR